jgi:hypothetical protein
MTINERIEQVRQLAANWTILDRAVKDALDRMNMLYDRATLNLAGECRFEIELRARAHEWARSDSEHSALNAEWQQLAARRDAAQLELELARWRVLNAILEESMGSTLPIEPVVKSMVGH